ncbi:MAG: acyl-CoA dehydrogenase family protein [Pseudomonadales bacterium]
MNFEFSDEQHQIRDQARSVLNDNCSPAVVRRVLEGDELYAAELWQQVVDLGWPATTIPEEYGGLGLSHLELIVIAEELGRACAPIPFASSVYLATEAILMAGSPEQKSTWLPKLAAGEVIGTLAYAEGPGQTTAATLGTTLSNGKLSGCKSTVADAEIAQLMIVVVKSDKGDGASLCLCPMDSPMDSPMGGSQIKCDHVNTIDPSLNHADVTFDAADAELLGAEGEGWALLEKVLDRAAILYAWEQLGGAERCLEMAKDYSMQRYAFGRPVGSFQAIKHKLAEMYVKNTLARSNGYFGAWALATNAIELPLAAATARVGSTQAYYYASKENIQTHGGMGYTWEFDCQFYYRRAKVLAVAIGSERLWQDKLISASDIAVAI